jgi:hypothetical protein
MDSMLVDDTISVEGGHKWTVMLVEVTITVEGVINGKLYWLTLPLL